MTRTQCEGGVIFYLDRRCNLSAVVTKSPIDLSLHLTLAVKTSSIRKGRLQPEAESS